jgi:hypothetical protein
MNAIYENLSTNTFDSRIEHRNRVDLLRSRVYLLRGRDRLWMTMYLENGIPINQMARMCGKNASTVHRRICKVTKLLLEGEYIKCLRIRDRFSKTEMLFAREHFLNGFSYRAIAKRHCTSCYNVKKTVREILGVLEGKE